MKKILFIILLGLWTICSKAQDSSLYSGNSKIYLYNKKIISPVKLWKIDSVRTEFIFNGNLTEVLTADISKIITLNYEITFTYPFAIKKEYFDLIISLNNDTIRGFIIDIAPSFITYRPPGGRKSKTTKYKSYLLMHTTNNIPAPQVTGNTEVENYSAPDSSFWATITAVESKDRLLNNDIIVTTNGEVIWCTINKQTDAAIYYHIARHGADPDFKLNMTAVKKVVNNANGPFENFESLKNTRYSEILLKENNINPDRIYTIDGNSISCNILSISEYDIYYHISMSGKDPRVKIPQSLVKRYEQGITNQDMKPKVKNGTKTFLIITGGVVLTYVLLFAALLSY